MDAPNAPLTAFPLHASDRRKPCQNCRYWLEPVGCCHCDGAACRNPDAFLRYRYWRPLRNSTALLAQARRIAA